MTLDLGLEEAALAEASLGMSEDTVYASDLTADAQNAGDADAGDAFDTQVWDHDIDTSASTTDLGINVGWYAAGAERDSLIFINQLKGAFPWGAINGELGDLTLDENGYVTSLSGDARARADILFHSASLQGIEPFTGTFRLYGQGDGIFSLGTGLEDNILADTITADLPTETIDGEEFWYVDWTYNSAKEDGSSQRIKMFIEAVTTDDYINNLALVHESHLDEFREGEVFAPEFLEDLAGYDTLRFMDWMFTNKLNLDENGAALDPEQRYISADHFTFNMAGGGSDSSYPSSAPIEYIVALANTTDANLWLNLPADITDARVQYMAQYVRDNLDEGLSVSWEYGNEIWNSAYGFHSHQYATYMAEQTFAGLETSGALAAAEWSAYRGPQVYDLVADVLEGSAISSHYVAGLWAHSTPVLSNGTINENSFSAVYFNAEQAQLMDDAPSKPVDIITDYAIGLYHGGASNEVEDYIVDTYDTDHQRAEILARWLLFGLDDSSFYDLGTDALTAPATEVSYHEGINIAVSQLIYKDVQAGLDPLRDLDQVLRLSERELQYRGIEAAEWTTILIFDAEPPKTLTDMALDVELIGVSYKYYGSLKTGVSGSILSNSDIRLGGHLDYVESLGLNFVAYEGGPHLDSPRPGLEGAYAAFEKDGYSAVVLSAWLDRMEVADVDLLMFYMSHDRTAGDGDPWGAQDYAGQPLSDAPKAWFLKETIASGSADHAEGYDPVQALNAPELADELTWSANDNWSTNSDGSFTETGQVNDRLVGTLLLLDGARSGLTLSLDIGATDAAPGHLRIVVTAFGAGRSEVLSWNAAVTDGQSLALELDDIADDFTALEIVIRRTGQKQGSLTVENLEVLQPAPELLPTDVSAFASEGWQHDQNWSLDSSGVAREMHGSLGKMKAEFDFEPTEDRTAMLSFDVETSEHDAGKLRVVIRGQGDEFYALKKWEAHVVDGQKVQIRLEDCPADLDTMKIIIKRVGRKDGELCISNLSLTSPAEQDTAPVVADAAAPITQAAATQTTVTSTEVTNVQYRDNWHQDSTGAWTETLGKRGALSTSLTLDSQAQDARTLTFDYVADPVATGSLTVVFRTAGPHGQKLMTTQVALGSDGSITIPFDFAPVDYEQIHVIIRKSEAYDGGLTISGLTLNEVAAPAAEDVIDA